MFLLYEPQEKHHLTTSLLTFYTQNLYWLFLHFPCGHQLRTNTYEEVMYKQRVNPRITLNNLKYIFQ